MTAKTSVRDARYGKTGGNSAFLKKLKKSHELGRANSAMSQMRATNKHNARVSSLVKKTFGEDKEGRMTNWMDDDVREAVIEALIETELYEKKAWLGYSAPAKAPGRVSRALTRGGEKARSAGRAVSSRAGAAGTAVGGAAKKAGAKVAGTRAYQATASAARQGGRSARARGYLAKRKTRGARNVARSGVGFVKTHGTRKAMGSGLKDVAKGAKKLVGRSYGKSSRSPIAPVARKRAIAQMKRGAGGAGMAVGGAALATAGAYGAYRGGKALRAKYKARKAAKEENFDARENYHAVMESLIGE